MGAHTIGNAEIFNSGFHGPWVSGEATMFNNQYYANLRYSTVQYSAVQYSTTTSTTPTSGTRAWTGL